MKKILLATLLVISLGTMGCGAEADNDVTIIGGADGPTSIFLSSKTSEEEITDELEVSIPGTWQTATIGYVDGDDIQPEYYVQFTDSEINYGHMKDGAFTLDHSNVTGKRRKRVLYPFIAKFEYSVFLFKSC